MAQTKPKLIDRPKVRIVGGGAIRISPNDIVNSRTGQEEIGRTRKLVSRLKETGRFPEKS